MGVEQHSRHTIQTLQKALGIRIALCLKKWQFLLIFYKNVTFYGVKFTEKFIFVRFLTNKFINLGEH
jgi:hypothetical protein